MALIFRSLVVIFAVFSAVTVGSCSTRDSDPSTVRIETWGTQTTKVGDGPARTTRTHTVENRAVPIVPEKALLGNWQLKDEGDRSCLVELYLEPRGTTQRRWAQGLVACSNGMKNIDSWLLIDGNIVLFDPSGNQIGTFSSVTERAYSGVFTLTTKLTNRATLKRF